MYFKGSFAYFCQCFHIVLLFPQVKLRRQCKSDFYEYHCNLVMFLTGEANFIKSLLNFDKDNISDRVLKKIGQYCKQTDFQPEIIGKVSHAARSLCMWVKAMEVRDTRPCKPRNILPVFHYFM